MTVLSKQLRSIPMRYPFAFGVVISTVKTSFSDILVQKVVQQKEEIDWKRNIAFATFGCFYLGAVQYAIYVPFFGRLFPNAAKFAAKPFREKLKDRKGIFAVFSQVFLDQCVHHPLLYFPAFYCTKEFVMNHENPSIHNALSLYQKNMKEDLIALWKIWVPGTILNFSFMPMYMRIPWVAGTSLVWTMILSAMRGGDSLEDEKIVGGSTTGDSLKILNQSISDVWSSPVDLDPNLAHLSVSASGPDKVGWVALVARNIADYGGNVTHSKMLRLGNDFTILMHVAVKPQNRKKLIAGLYSNEELDPLNVKVSPLTRRQTGQFVPPTYHLKIHCVGKDRPGILAKVAEELALKGLSVDNISTELRRGYNGRRDFVVDTDITTVETLNEDGLHQLIQDLQQLKSSLNLDVLDIRVKKM